MISDDDVHGHVKPLLRGRIHLGAIPVAVPAAIALVVVAGTAMATAASAVYGTSLVALFTVSGIYHRFRGSPRGREILRRADHATIYLLIAGSYTPVALAGIGGRSGWIIAGAVWTAAGVGALLKLGWFDRTQVIGWALYLSLGWVSLAGLPALVHHLSGPALVLLVLGGVAYTVGAIVLATRWPDPFPVVFGYHEVWHVFVVIAATLHYVAILLVVRA